MRWREGDVIRKLRMMVGWKLEDLAKASGVGLQVIHRLEVGKTKEAKRRTLTMIAAAFGLTDRQLLDAIPDAIDLPIQARRPDVERRKVSARRSGAG